MTIALVSRKVDAKYRYILKAFDKLYHLVGYSLS